MNRTLILSVFAALLPLAFSARADEASEAKLKEQLKSVSLQLRTAQQERATMQTAQAAMEATNKTLDDQVKKQAKALETMDKEMKDAKEKAETLKAEQTAKINSLELDLANYKTTLDKWQAANLTLDKIAKKKESERAKLVAKSADLERKVTGLRAQNVELYKLGSEILERYEKFGIGEALAAREPFTGNTKVKLQNIVQDYNGKLLDQTAKP